MSTLPDEVNPASDTLSAELVLTAPNPTIDVPFGDKLLNLAEAAVNQTISGTTGLTGPGQTVILTIDGNPISDLIVSVNDSGVWTVTLTPAQMLALGDGKHTIEVTALDRADNDATTSLDFDALITAAPTITIPEVLFGDGILTLNEVDAGATLSGG